MREKRSLMTRKAITSTEKTTTAVTNEAAKALADWPEELSACPLPSPIVN